MQKMTLAEHYGQLLGLSRPWRVADVRLDIAGKLVDIRLVRDEGVELPCPECGRDCSVYDHPEERSWRHLDTMQFETRLTARVPRINCPSHGVKTASVPWAGKHSRFTAMFEAFAIQVIECCGNVTAAAELLRAEWKTVNAIIRSAVERGLTRRKLDDVRRLGLDEKSFRPRHDYATVLNDLDGARVLDVTRGRTEESAVNVLNTLPEEVKQETEAVAMDMWPAFINAVGAALPKADIIHDRFHVKRMLNDAVDKVRRGEQAELRKLGDRTLDGSRYLFLKNEDNLTEAAQKRFEELKTRELRTSRAWAAKETFEAFWQSTTEKEARSVFARWHKWAARSRLPPLVKAASTLASHLENLVTYIKHHITNAVSEGINSKIQLVIAEARGMRNFDRYRDRILFFCGKLDMLPIVTH
jgi:transposase